MAGYATKAASRARAEAFKRIEVEFINTSRENGEATREVGEASWRVGPLEIEVRRGTLQARLLHNQEPMVRWRPIASLKDLVELIAEAPCVSK